MDVLRDARMWRALVMWVLLSLFPSLGLFSPGWHSVQSLKPEKKEAIINKNKASTDARGLEGEKG